MLATAVVVGACAGLVVAVVGVRLDRLLRDRREQRLLAGLRPSLIEIAAGEDVDGLAVRQLAETTGATARAVDRWTVTMLGKVRGEPADQLVQVLRAHGRIHRAHRDLGHRGALRRAKAAQILGLTGEQDARERIEKALGDRHLEVRTRAVYALGLLGHPDSAGPVLDAVGGSASSREAPFGLPAGAAADALRGMGVGIAGALQAGLVSAHPHTRIVAAHVTGVGSFTRGLPLLRHLLEHDPEIAVREVCAVAIGRMGRGDDVAVLARQTGSDVPRPVRRAGALALGDLGASEAVPVLSRLVLDQDPRLREHAAMALLTLGPQGRQALAAHASSPAARFAVDMADRRSVAQ